MRWLILVLLVACATTPPRPATPATTEAAPAIPAVLAAFDRYQVVAISAGHGQKDLDDFLLTLLRDPRVPDVVDDIVVECGNTLYQPVLDRYIAGEDVELEEVRPVWRNTTQSMMCSYSAFYEQLFPLVRAINRRLPPAQRLRVLAGDPPIDWDRVVTIDDAGRYFRRDESIAAVMEREVLAKHRKALMLFGTFHLMHGQPLSAVSMYERAYPGVTFVVSDLGNLDTARFAAWANPSLVTIRGTDLGALPPSAIWTPPMRMRDCHVRIGFGPELERPVEDVVDAFLYLGPRDLRLFEPTPASIALDTPYLTELQRREALTAFSGVPPRSLDELRDELRQEAQWTLLGPPLPPPDPAAIEAECRERAHAPR